MEVGSYLLRAYTTKITIYGSCVTPRFPKQRNNANINIRVSTTTEYYIYFSKFI